MRFRFRIGTIMIGIAAVGLGLFAFIEWRRGVPRGPSAAVRIAQEVLAERTARRSSGPSTADSATVAAFALAAIVGSKSLRALAGRRAESLRVGGRSGR
jgi:hypothetical protein